jgi:hypothetical protein
MGAGIITGRVVTIKWKGREARFIVLIYSHTFHASHPAWSKKFKLFSLLLLQYLPVVPDTFLQIRESDVQERNRLRER